MPQSLKSAPKKMFVISNIPQATLNQCERKDVVANIKNSKYDRGNQSFIRK